MRIIKIVKDWLNKEPTYKKMYVVETTSFGYSIWKKHYVGNQSLNIIFSTAKTLSEVKSIIEDDIKKQKLIEELFKDTHR